MTGGEHPVEIRPGNRFPYTTCGEWVAVAEIPHGSKALYFILRAHTNTGRGDDRCWPLKKTLAALMGFKQARQIDPYLDALVAIGAVEVEKKRSEDGMRRYNVYTVHEAPPADHPGAASLPDYYRQIESAGAEVRSDAPPDTPKKGCREVRSDAPRGVRSDAPREVRCTPPEPPEVKPPEEEPLKEERSEGASAAAGPPVGGCASGAPSGTGGEPPAPDARSEGERDAVTADDVADALPAKASMGAERRAEVARRLSRAVAEWGLEVEHALLMVRALPVKTAYERAIERTASPEAVRNAVASLRGLPGQRPEVDRLCEELADGIASNGFMRPQVTREWRIECGKLLDRDRIKNPRTNEEQPVTPQVAAWVLKRTMESHFWGTKGNIRSMGKFRKQFERLAKDAWDSYEGGGEGPRHRETAEERKMRIIRSHTDEDFRDFLADLEDPNGHRERKRAAKAVEAPSGETEGGPVEVQAQVSDPPPDPKPAGPPLSLHEVGPPTEEDRKKPIPRPGTELDDEEYQRLARIVYGSYSQK